MFKAGRRAARFPYGSRKYGSDKKVALASTIRTAKVIYCNVLVLAIYILTLGTAAISFAKKVAAVIVQTSYSIISKP